MGKGDVTMTFDAKTASFIGQINNMLLKLSEAQGVAVKTGEKVTGLMDVFEDFGNKISKKDVGQMIADSFGIPTSPADALKVGIEAIGKAFEFMNEQAQAGAESLKNFDAQTKTLIQTANSLADLQAQKAKAREISATHGISLEESGKLMESARNRGMDKEIDLFAKTTAFTNKPGGLVDAVADIKSSFGDKAGNSRQIINKILKGAGDSKLSLDTFTPEAVKAAPGVGMVGGTADELIAMMTSGAGFFGTGEKAAERIARGAAALNKAGVGGKGSMLTSFDEFMKLSPRAQKKAGGDAMEFNEFKRFMMAKREEIDTNLASTRAVGAAPEGSDLMEEKIRLRAADPESQAAQRAGAAKARLENAEAKAFGKERLNAEAADVEGEARDVESGASLPARFLKSGARKAAKKIFGSEEAVKAVESPTVLNATPMGTAAGLLEFIYRDVFGRGNGAMVPNNIDAGNE